MLEQSLSKLITDAVRPSMIDVPLTVPQRVILFSICSASSSQCLSVPGKSRARYAVFALR